MPGDFFALIGKLDALANDLTPQELHTALSHVGEQAVEDMHKVASDAVGGDRSFSGWPRLGELTAGYRVVGANVRIIPRPRGGWIVADRGRKATSAPSRASAGGNRMFGEGKRSSVNMLTPWGWRSYSKDNPMVIGRTTGKHALTKGENRIQKSAPEVLAREVHKILAGLF